MLFSLLVAFISSVNEVTVSCKLLDDGTVIVNNSFVDDADAWAQFTDSYATVGWGQIHIWSNPTSPSYNQMYCAGFADGYSTQKRILQFFQLYKEMQTEIRTGNDWNLTFAEWFSENINYMRRMTSHPTDDYWKRTALIMAQFDGMLDGYNKATTSPKDKMTELDLWILQSAGDLDDLTGVLDHPKQKDPEFTLHCTGLIKIAPDFSDIFFAQNTWSDYRELHAYLKEYNLNVPEFKSHRVQISTRTGHIASVDDFWANDQGLLILETTMHNFNKTLYDLHVKPQSVLTWIRSYHAAFATDNGKEWTEHFIRENSGTYNNEYIVLDTKKFVPNQQPESDLLWMIEQFPGNYKSQDMTSILVNQTYFPSINTPYFEELFNLAGYPEQQEKEPHKKEFWSYRQPRTQVIERDQGTLTSFQKFKEFMRYNNYKEDSILSKVKDTTPGHEGQTFAEPAQGILARYDLRGNDQSKKTPYGDRNHFGGLDSKTSSVLKFISNQTWDAINSPEYKDNAAWSFDKWNEENPELKINWVNDLPSEFKYDWMEFSPLDYCQVFGTSKKKCLDIPGCGFCIYSQECMLGDKDAPSTSLNKKCEDGWTVKQEEKPYALPLILSVTLIIVVFVIVIFASAFYSKWKKSQNQPQFTQL